MQRETITRRTLARWTAWAAAAGIAGAQSRPQLESTAARQADERAWSLETFEIPKETEPAFVFQP